MATYALTTLGDTLTGTTGNDTFNATYDAAAGLDTFNDTDIINGSAGIDTLNISHFQDVAITPPDALWTGISNIEKIVLNTQGDGAQTITTSNAFQAAFGTGVDLKTTTSGAGAINIIMTTFTGMAILKTTSLAGAQTITTGSGITVVTGANSSAGAITIKGVGLTSATATTTGAGAQSIGDGSGNGANLDSVTATSAGGAQSIISTSTNAVTVAAISAAGTQTIITGAGDDIITASTTASVNTIDTGDGNDTITISAIASGNYTINAGAGDDTMTGGAGVDTLIGGSGNDTYYVNTTGDVITENSGVGEGFDVVYSTVSYTLGANVENLVLMGTAVINGAGNGLNNQLTGNSADNTLSGYGGVDTMIGGLGNDTYGVNDTNDLVVENAGEGTDTVVSIASSYTLTANVENLVLGGTAAINGAGNGLNNQLTGNSADNVLSGYGGVDTMIGGLGNDTYGVNDTNDLVVENAGEGTDTVVSIASSYTLTANVENLVLGGTAAINGAGNGLNNQLTGNSADNVLSGYGGVDTMIGGLGNDTYGVNDTNDLVVENADEGTDTVVSIASSYTLTANVENLVLGGIAAINGAGNGLNNQLTGNSADNVLSGYGGVDTMIGGLGNDTYGVNDTNDLVVENAGEGTDTVVSIASSYTLTANVENLILAGIAAINGAGNGLNNQLTGNSANNSLTGDEGADILLGGLGKDTYNLTETTAATDTLSIATGDSVVSGYDVANGFKLGTGTVNIIGVDRLDLASTVIATNAAAVNGSDSGAILSHSINNGIISFDNIDSYTTPLAITAANLADTLGYLQANITGSNTVAFVSEGNTFVFQDGGVQDTLVELIGVTAQSVNTSGLATNAVWII